MKHVTVIGTTGQLARALIKQSIEHDRYTVQAYGRDACDLSDDFSSIEAFANSIPATDGIILAAAYTAVDAAEDNQELATKINGIAPGIFAQECENRSIPLIHVSTDYVFNGVTDRPWKEGDATDPINAYGASKLAGEQAISSTNVQAGILRTSWVFDGTGKNFMTTMLRLAQSRSSLNIVNDQIGRPTYAGHLADACFVVLDKLCSTPAKGTQIINATGSGPEVSWAEFANYIFDIAAEALPHRIKVNGIPSREYPTPAARPAYSVLNLNKLESSYEFEMPSWHEGVKEAFKEWEIDNSTP